MNTLTLDTRKYGQVRIHYHSDWSGLAHISYTYDGEPKDVEIPASLLLAIGKEAALEYAVDAMMNFVERIDFPPGETEL